MDPPAGWSPRTQAGASLDLSQGDGLRLWPECRARCSELESAADIREEPPRFGSPAARAPRLGQGIFRVQVLDAYGRACAVTTEHSVPVLEAAHIVPYAEGGPHELQNGLSLRTDLHRLFDRGYVTVDEDYRLVVGHRLREEYDNGRSYYGLHGRPLQLPASVDALPSPTLLERHRERIFRG